jgi:hypothetical protein
MVAGHSSESRSGWGCRFEAGTHITDHDRHATSCIRLAHLRERGGPTLESAADGWNRCRGHAGLMRLALQQPAPIPDEEVAVISIKFDLHGIERAALRWRVVHTASIATSGMSTFQK